MWGGLSLPGQEGDIIACDVTTKARTGKSVQARCFLTVDTWHLILMEPSRKAPALGIVRWVGLKAISTHPPTPHTPLRIAVAMPF